MEKNKKVTIDHFTVIKQIGNGFTSRVVLAEDSNNKIKLALKIFKPHDNRNIIIENFRKEATIMLKLSNSNIINICFANEKGILNDGKNKEEIIYIGLELAENAELFDFIADPALSFNESISRSLFSQLLNGLKYIHDNGIAHRDLKTENIFLDENFILKIGDFGFSKYIDTKSNDGKLKTQLGTTGYQSPELLEGKEYNGEANDIFACGVILFILSCAYPPFREARVKDTWYKHIYIEDFSSFWKMHEKAGLSEELKDLLTNMLRYKNRITINEILNHPWLKGPLPTKEEYTIDMLSRKKIVDERRKRDSIENLTVNNSDCNSSIYRSESAEAVIKSLYDNLENNCAYNFPIKNIEILPKYSLRFNDNDILKVYKYLIAILVDDYNSSVTLVEHEFSLLTTIPFSYKLDDDCKEERDSISEISIMFNLYLSESEFVVVEVIKDNSTNIFAFKKFMNCLSNTINEDY